MVERNQRESERAERSWKAHAGGALRQEEGSIHHRTVVEARRGRSGAVGVSEAEERASRRCKAALARSPLLSELLEDHTTANKDSAKRSGPASRL